MSNPTLSAYKMDFMDYDDVVLALKEHKTVRLVNYCKTHSFPVIAAQKALKDRRGMWNLRMSVDGDDLILFFGRARLYTI